MNIKIKFACNFKILQSLALVFAILFSLCGALGAGAEISPYSFGEDGLDKEKLIELLKVGEAAIVDITEEGRLKQVVVVAIVNAPRDEIFKLVTKVEEHPNFINNVASVKVHRRDEKEILYDYEVEMPISNIKITLSMKPNPPGVVESVATGGDIKEGQWRWELHPVGEKQTMVFYYAYANLAEGSFVFRQVMKIDNSLEFGVNVTSALAGLTAVKRKAEGREVSREEAKRRAKLSHPADVRSLIGRGPLKNLKELEPFVKRGYFVLIEDRQDGSIRQVNVAKTVNVPRKQIFTVLATPEDWPKFIPHIKKHEVLYAEGNLKKIDAAMSLPILGSFSYGLDFLMKPPSAVYSKASGGALPNGRWIWEFEPLSEESSLVIYSFYADMRPISWFFRTLYSIDPIMEHGASIGGGIAGMKNMTNRALELYKNGQPKPPKEN